MSVERWDERDSSRRGEDGQAVDVLVAGGGFVGCALALALARAGFAVVLVDPGAAATAPSDERASAVAAGARRMLETLGAWVPAHEAQPIARMIVTDGRLEDAARPPLLDFAGDAEPGEPFAHMVENGRLLASLARACREAGVEVRAARVTGIDRGAASSAVATDDGARHAARLVAACDGARSALREAAGIRMVGWSYGQSGIVTTIAHERPHEGRADEHFLPAGPFAVLPLTDDARGRHRSSLVWTERSAEADRLVALAPAAFHGELVARLGHGLGAVEALAPPRAYPLGAWLARRFVDRRLALVGDAAHVIHPIAGQGLNLGFRDVAALVETLVDAARLGLDFGDLGVLERYERWRRFDTAMMGLATDGLNRLFSNDLAPLRALRDLGLGLVDRLPRLKEALIRNAAGLAGETPKLLRGELP